jgi:hypothetical protein
MEGARMRIRFWIIHLLGFMLLSCMKDMVSDWREPNFVGLKNWDAVYFSNGSPSVSRSIRFIPDFKPTILDYTVYADSGLIRFYVEAYPSHAKTDFQFDSKAIPKSIGKAGIDSYRMGFHESGLAVFHVTDTTTGDTVTYSFHFKLNPPKPQVANGFPKLKRIAICNGYPYRGQVSSLPGNEGPTSGSGKTYDCTEAYPPLQSDSILFGYQPPLPSDSFSYVLFASSVNPALLLVDAEFPTSEVQVYHGEYMVPNTYYSELNRNFFAIKLDSTRTEEFKLVLTDTVSHQSQSYHLTIKNWAKHHDEIPKLNPGGWEEIPVPDGVLNLDVLNDSVVFSFSQTSQGVLKWFLPGDVTWIWLDDNLSWFRFSDAKTGLKWVGDSTLMRTVDGGVTWESLPHIDWTPMPDGIPWSRVYSRGCYVSGKTIYMLGNTWTAESPVSQISLYKSTDAGLSWNIVDIPEPGSDAIASLVFADSLRGVVLLAGGKKYVTDDGGANWSPIEVGKLSLRAPLIQQTVDKTLMLIEDINDLNAAGYHVSFDFGKTWSEINFPSLIEMGMGVEAPIPVVFLSPHTGFGLIKNSHGGYVLKTRDGGKTWALDFFSPDFQWFSIYQTAHRIFVNTWDGRLLWREKPFE